MAKTSKAKRSTRAATKASEKKLSAKPSDQPTSHFGRYGVTLLLLGVVVLVWLSLLSFNPTDPPSSQLYPQKSPVANRVGAVGCYIAYALRYWVGFGAYAALGILTVWSFVMLLGRLITDLPWRLVGLFLLVLSFSVGAFIQDPGFLGDIVNGRAGILGSAVGNFLLNKTGQAGSAVILVITFCLGLLFAADNLLKLLSVHAVKLVQRGAAWLPRRNKLALAGVRLPGASTRTPARVSVPGIKPLQPKSESPDRPRPKADENKRPKSPSLFGRRDDKKNPIKKRPSSPTSKSEKKAATAPKRDYLLPSIDLLEEPLGGYNEVAEIQAVQRKLVLQQTLDDFGVEAKVDGYMTGPVITLFEVSLAPGVKISQIGSLATDIARSLAVSGVRIVPPRFGKDTVGIEVPNLDKEIVRLKELMRMKPTAEKKMRLPMYLGKDAGGDAIVEDLAKCPHMLIAGTTGSGKSVCINTIILSLLMTRKPEDVRFILVDPKMVEMAAFEKLPHLLCPTINDMKKAEDILEWATEKMDERYELLREAGVRNIDSFNKLSKDQIYERFGAETEEERAQAVIHLPSFVIIIDELADLMMTSSKEVEGFIIRIAQKARAVGIHLVLATQRPSANVVTGLIKSNMPCRVSFRVASGQESRIVLDQKGGEVLLGQGDMLVLQPGTSSLERAQGTYVDDTEINAVVSELQNNGPQVFDGELTKLQSRSSGELSNDRDELFDKAVDIVLMSQRGSVSLLQRRMGVGYGRASRIIDQMAEAGILGTHKGSQARECMITLDDWEVMKNSIAADQSGSNSLDGQGTSY